MIFIGLAFILSIVSFNLYLNDFFMCLTYFNTSLFDLGSSQSSILSENLFVPNRYGCYKFFNGFYSGFNGEKFYFSKITGLTYSIWDSSLLGNLDSGIVYISQNVNCENCNCLNSFSLLKTYASSIQPVIYNNNSFIDACSSVNNFSIFENKLNNVIELKKVFGMNPYYNYTSDNIEYSNFYSLRTVATALQTPICLMSEKFNYIYTSSDIYESYMHFLNYKHMIKMMYTMTSIKFSSDNLIELNRLVLGYDLSAFMMIYGSLEKLSIAGSLMYKSSILENQREACDLEFFYKCLQDNNNWGDVFSKSKDSLIGKNMFQSIGKEENGFFDPSSSMDRLQNFWGVDLVSLSRDIRTIRLNENITESEIDVSAKLEVILKFKDLL